MLQTPSAAKADTRFAAKLIELTQLIPLCLRQDMPQKSNRRPAASLLCYSVRANPVGSCGPDPSFLSTMSASKKLLIKGITESGQVFRPSDWAERMCGNLCTFRNRRMYYSPLLRPVIIAGQKGVVVDPSLAELHPQLFREIIDFAEQNALQTAEYVEV